MLSSRPLVLLAALLSAACAGGGEPPAPDPEVVGEAGDREPRLRAVGPRGQVPAAVLVHAGRRAFPEVGVPAPEGVILDIQPAVAGQLTVADESTLSFQPAAGFAPKTRYTATLRALPVGAEALTGEWTLEFETPPFGLVRAALHRQSAGETAIDLVFSAAVEPDAAARRVTFTAGGQPAAPVAVTAGDTASEVRFRFAPLPTDAEVQVALAAGVPWQGDPSVTADDAAATVELSAGPPVEIRAAVVKEGVNGHYIDVVCSDEAVEGERYFWDEDTYEGWWVSERCLLSPETAAAALHLSPDADFTVSAAPAGFRLFGDFPRGSYTLELDAGAKTVDGGVLAEGWQTSLVVPERQPRLRFAEQGRYLPRSAWRNLPLRHLNVDAATLTVRHIPEQNLLFWLSGPEKADERTSDVVLQQALTLARPADAEETTWLDVGSLLPDVQRGVYELSVDAGSPEEVNQRLAAGAAPHDRRGEGPAHAAARILLTDLQLVAKWSAPAEGEPWSRKLWVWALEAHTGKPASGVDVRLVRASGQVLARCTTPSDGGCTLTPPLDTLDKAPPLAILASKDGDLTYLRFSDLALEPDADTGGAPYGQPGAYRAAVVLDRGVYRPGETAHLTGIIRTESHVAPGEPLPVTARLLDPRDREIRRQQLAADAAGVVTADLPFADFAPTGRYRVRLEAGDKLLGEATFNVEEFVPERLAVEAALPADAPADQPVNVDVSARWLFGGSAEGARAALTCRLQPARFYPSKANMEYDFGPAFADQDQPRPFTLSTRETRLDEAGKAQLSCPPAANASGLAGGGKLLAEVVVFEGEGGRSTQRTAEAPVHPEKFYLGLRANAAAASAGEQVQIDGIVADWTGEITSGPSAVNVEIFRLEEEIAWLWDDDLGESSRKRLLRRVREGQLAAQVQGGRFSLPFTPATDSAGYLLVARAGDALTELHLPGSGARYWWEPGQDEVDATPRPEKPTPLALQAPAEVAVGEEVAVTVTAPWAGDLLWTVETDEVVRHEWKSVQAGEVTWTFEVEAFTPNVYVSALLLKDPHLESSSSYLPDRGFAVRAVRLKPADYAQVVKLTAPAEVKPHDKLTVQLQVEGAGSGPVTATVAAVDEGVLQLTSHADPDPLGQIFARRALGVRTFETIGWSLAQTGQPGRRTGGDGGGGGGRVQMVKPVALWSGPVTLDANGRASVTFDVPSYRGKLRVMAVAASATRVGAAAASVLVRDPLTLQATLPRFLVDGDTAEIPVFLSNLSGKAQDVAIEIKVSEVDSPEGPPIPALTTDGPTVQRLPLAAGASGSVVFRVRAHRVPSAGRVSITAKAGGLVSEETLEIPLFSRLPEVRQRVSLPLPAGTVDLAPHLAGWLPGSDRTSLWVTANPYGAAFTHLRYLVRYPYGCVEQTTSGTRPLLYASNLLQNVDPELAAEGGVDALVRSGLERVLSMQTPGGGFGYWPGSEWPTPWGSAYATHLLLEAKEAGHSVPDAALADALRYLQEVGINDSERGTMAYAHYVLARGGKGQPAAALRRLPEVGAREPESRLLLMAAVHRSGDRRFEAELKEPDLTPIDPDRENDWTFYSDRRRRAMTLAVLEELFPGDPALKPLADLVADSIDDADSYWYTTQELAWAISGLGRRVQSLSSGAPAATLTADARALAATSGAAGQSWQVAAAGSRRLALQVPADAKDLTLHLVTRGVRAQGGAPTGGDGLQISRQFRDINGQIVDPSKRSLGEPLFVEVLLTNTAGEDIQNVALVDRLPAGWEIENPDLGRGALPAWADGMTLWGADHRNLRDDRLEVFGGLPAGATVSVVYGVRAVSAGRFAHPAASAEAMYDPAYWARSGSGEVEIVGPWAEAM